MISLSSYFVSCCFPVHLWIGLVFHFNSVGFLNLIFSPCMSRSGFAKFLSLSSGFPLFPVRTGWLFQAKWLQVNSKRLNHFKFSKQKSILTGTWKRRLVGELPPWSYKVNQSSFRTYFVGNNSSLWSGFFQSNINILLQSACLSSQRVHAFASLLLLMEEVESGDILITSVTALRAAARWCWSD